MGHIAHSLVKADAVGLRVGSRFRHVVGRPHMPCIEIRSS